MLEETWGKGITGDCIKKSCASVIKGLRAVIDAGGGHIEGIRDNHAGTHDDSE